MAGNRDRHEPDYVPPVPAEGLIPMTVTPEVIKIAKNMKRDAEKKLKIVPGYTIYTPLFYIKKSAVDYCIRVSSTVYHYYAACILSRASRLIN